jgi:hypothetical protein
MTIDISEAKLERNKFGLWAGWALATGAGMLLGFLPAEPLADLFNLGVARVIVPLLAGVLIGLLQWLLLRPFLTSAADWIISAGFGWMAGYALGLLVIRSLAGGMLEAVIGYIVFGVIVSALQWPVLRREIPSLLPWLIANVIGWTAAFLVGQFAGSQLYLASGLAPEITAAIIAGISGLVAGAITGLAFIWIVRQPEAGRVQPARE